MATAEKYLLVIGMQQTGKTTFLAALWDVVGSHSTNASLVLESLDGDQQHLNELRDLWASCQQIPRTLLSKEKIVSMLLRDKGNGIRSRVSFPDMDGEAFERQWTEREWLQSHAEIVRRSSSGLLFVHPERVREGVLIRNAAPIVDRISKTSSPKAASTHSTEVKRVENNVMPSTPSFAPTQVQLVELLQFLRLETACIPAFRLGVIISAWDTVVRAYRQCTPDEWLSRRMPMLHQYLRSNSDETEFRIYGVSAQGGDLVRDAETLLRRNSPSDRIIVVEGKQVSHDITAPVRWVMGGVS